jgi:YVTN family beta-propeller protein
LNLAARLCAQAGPGQILASEAVIHLAAKVEGIAYVDPRTFRLKGYAKPVRAVEVVPEERARRAGLRRIGVRTRRAARRPAFWVAAVGALATVVLLAVLLPGALGGKSSPSSMPSAGAGVQASNLVVRVDTGFNRVVASVPVGKAPVAATTGAGSVWVANSGDGTVSRIDPVTNKVSAVIPVGKDPLDIAFDGSHIWVANYVSHSVSEIDPGSNKVVASIDLQIKPVSLAFVGDALLVGGGLGTIGIVANERAPVVRIDRVSHQAAEFFRIDESECALLATRGDAAWALSDFGVLTRFDPTTGSESLASTSMREAAPSSWTRTGSGWRASVFPER